MESLPDDTRRLAHRLASLAEDPDWMPWPAPTVLASVDSTMSVLRQRAGEGALQGSAVVADEQTAGRGRHGRSWQSPPGSGVWASVLLRPEQVEPRSLGVLPLLIGLHVCEGLSRLTGAPLWVKWPNDIVFSEAAFDSDSSTDAIATPSKLAGVLAERLSDGAIVIGVGVNVLAAPADLDAVALIDIAGDITPDVVPRIRPSRDSDSVTHPAVLRQEAAREVLRAVARAASAWERGEHRLDAYRRRCITLGRAVIVTTVAGAESWHGRAMDIDESGLLLVEDATGAVTAISAADVTLAR